MVMFALIIQSWNCILALFARDVTSQGMSKVYPSNLGVELGP